MKSILALVAVIVLITPLPPRATAEISPVEAAPAPATANIAFSVGDDAYFYDEAGNNGPCHSHAFFYDPGDAQARAKAKADCDSMNYRKGCAAYHMTLAYLNSRAC